MNNLVSNPKSALDNPQQTLPNGVIVTVSPAQYNANSATCNIDWKFNFAPVYNSRVTVITSWEFEIKAIDVFGGYTRVFVHQGSQIAAP